ncbi:VOC family protein [Shouchella clausii]|jgi:lactoylglutathione lyase|uniref:Glyoxalase n=1 Tax=Shouchella clausii TaxID=79880 RepID=A0A268S1R3_SHOCL|nr:VOC family protein [Shouchella clausii]PAD42830.1 glyoxalase [Bacillus sp. 7520-S]SPT77329.1 glyoxalase [Niallia circulans]MBU8597501.1 VOC family protein [Shouchella clausii]MCY1105568.1 VOC family protein [Shouchella clausii]MEB5482297.1 VOC family protein [Shouchella clausii]
MLIKHINLTVEDVQATELFLKNYFGMKCVNRRGNGFAAMFDDQQFVLTLMHGRDVRYPKTFHIGFPQETREKVDQIYARMKNDGYDITDPIESHGYTCYVQAPGGFRIEILSE